MAKAQAQMNSFWSTARDWLALAAAATSATFAGMIWWMARKRLATRYECYFEGKGQLGTIGVRIQVTNRGDDDILIEKVSVASPIKILVGEGGGCYGVSANAQMIQSASRVSEMTREKRIAPEAHDGISLLLDRDGGFNAVSRVSISLHILSRFPVTRQSVKQLTLMLPASIRNSQA
ncbi:MAG: hypothetical protein ABL907_22905 [Hyphomicrobium sp.]